MPWPVYKLAALVVGAVVLIAVGVVTASAAPAVLTAAAAGHGRVARPARRRVAPLVLCQPSQPVQIGGHRRHVALELLIGHARRADAR